MKKKESINGTSYWFNNEEQENSYILDTYGLRVKNRSAKKKPQKFTEKKERDLKD